jgi:ATP-dependent DNA ligase
MSLPLKRPFAPMEAAIASELPEDDGWQYEPKWDGFRCLAFKDGSRVELQSKAGQPLTRYFPEVAEMLAKVKAERFVIDGEIAVPVGSRFSFDDLLQRIHPAASRVQKLSKEHPAVLIVFDLLVDNDGTSITKLPLAERRSKLERFAKKFFKDPEHLKLSPATTDFQVAKRWLSRAGGDLDGVIAKRLDFDYRSGTREGMQKIKLARTADCVIGGFRYAEKEKVVGSLLLGLYDDAGLLNHVGFCSGLKASERKSLLKQLEPLIEPPGFTGRAPGGPSRWSTKRSAEWQPLRPSLVVEVSYDHFTGGRFRHGTSLIRWRPDKAPAQCRMDQITSGGHASLALLEAA